MVKVTRKHLEMKEYQQTRNDSTSSDLKVTGRVKILLHATPANRPSIAKAQAPYMNSRFSLKPFCCYKGQYSQGFAV